MRAKTKPGIKIQDFLVDFFKVKFCSPKQVFLRQFLGHPRWDFLTKK
jgi:hypothetical protein